MSWIGFTFDSPVIRLLPVRLVSSSPSYVNEIYSLCVNERNIAMQIKSKCVFDTVTLNSLAVDYEAGVVMSSELNSAHHIRFVG